MLTPLAITNKKALIQRYLRKTKKDSISECWLFGDCLDQNGYGQVRINNRGYRLNWLSLYLFNKITLESNLLGLHILDCKNKNCWNPAHLYAGDMSDNMMDIVRVGNHAGANKTHCIHGHEYTKENTQHFRGQRRCVICRKLHGN